MTSVANQPVGADSISGSVGKGVKSHAGERGTFLAPATSANATVGGVFGGTPGGSVGPGANGLPKAGAAVATLTSVEKKLQDRGV